MLCVLGYVVCRLSPYIMRLSNERAPLVVWKVKEFKKCMKSNCLQYGCCDGGKCWSSKGYWKSCIFLHCASNMLCGACLVDKKENHIKIKMFVMFIAFFSSWTQNIQSGDISISTPNSVSVHHFYENILENVPCLYSKQCCYSVGVVCLESKVMPTIHIHTLMTLIIWKLGISPVTTWFYSLIEASKISPIWVPQRTMDPTSSILISDILTSCALPSYI